MDYLIALGHGMNPNRPLNGCENNVRFCFLKEKQLCTTNCLSSLDVSEMFVSGVSSMYIYYALFESLFVMLSQKPVFKVHSLSSGKVEKYLCAACQAFTRHVNAWKN